MIDKEENKSMLEQITTTLYETMADAIEIVKMQEIDVLDYSHILKAILKHKYKGHELLLKMCRQSNKSIAFLENEIDTEVINFSQAQKVRTVTNDIRFSKRLENLLTLATNAVSNEFGDEYVATDVFIATLFFNKFTKNGKDTNVLVDFFEDDFSYQDVINLIVQERAGHQILERTDEENSKVLDKFAVDLVKKYREGNQDPVIGRDEEIRQVITTLSRKTKNNPILVGEPGVGKTAILEGIAERIVNRNIPETLKNKKIFSLDLAAVMAGASAIGEFEKRLKSIIDEVKKSNGRIILFIDEIHMIIGAGGNGTSMDASNILKPAMARGEIRLIGATTIDEYREIEKDKAFERRVDKIIVKEPTQEEAITILRGLKNTFESHHGVTIQDAAIVNAVKLSTRYISNRYLPDKAIDLLDEACARVELNINSMPEDLVAQVSKLQELQIEQENLKEEIKESYSKTTQERLDELKDEIFELGKEVTSKRQKWEENRDLIRDIKRLKAEREQLLRQEENARAINDLEVVARIQNGDLREVQADLSELLKIQEQRSDSGALKEVVSVDEIYQVLSIKTGIPAAKMEKSEKEKILNLDARMAKRILGQDHALKEIKNAILRNRAGMSNPNKPIGTFLFLGPSGTGKTITAEELAFELFDSKEALLRLDMSEFQDKNSISRLIGAPPGYVGYEKGGELTNYVKNNMYSIVLLDEIEKAHPEVFDLMLQVFDSGRLTDSKGTVVDFRNTIIILTSNIGAKEYMVQEDSIDETTGQYKESVQEAVLDRLGHFLRKEILNRLSRIIYYLPNAKSVLRDIVKLRLSDVEKYLSERNVKILATDEALDKLWQDVFTPADGARSIERYIESVVTTPISDFVLTGELQDGDIILIHLFDDEETGVKDFELSLVGTDEYSIEDVQKRIDIKNEKYANSLRKND